MSETHAGLLILQDAGEFQVWASIVQARAHKVEGIGEAIADGDSVIRAIRQRVPSIMAANTPLVQPTRQ